jgi:hypothetical protein
MERYIQLQCRQMREERKAKLEYIRNIGLNKKIS